RRLGRGPSLRADADRHRSLLALHRCVVTARMYTEAMAASSADDETGRYRQRRRTRAAIVAAAAEMLRAGRTPSINDIAEAADVSRRTVYLHFPTLDQLLLDATLGMLSQAAVDEAIDAADTDGDAD